eukprot:scaffold109174_cov34-Tisochrysis_lutea.AAC.4
MNAFPAVAHVGIHLVSLEGEARQESKPGGNMHDMVGHKPSSRTIAQASIERGFPRALGWG